MKTFRSGNAIVEYMLPLSLLVVVAIPALVALGGNLQNALKAALEQPSEVSPLTPGTTGGGANGGTTGTPTPPPALPPSTGSSLPPIGPASAYTTLSIPLANGKSVSIPNFPTNTATLVETVGANGTTEAYARAMEVMAQQLYEQGEITGSQLQSLLALANRGHDIAAIERFIEDYRKTYTGDPATFYDTKITWEGSTTAWDGGPEWTIGMVAQMVGNSRTYPNTEYSIDWYMNNAGWPSDAFMWNSGAEAFKSAYQQALSDGSLSNPAIKQVVDKLGLDILTLGDVFEEKGGGADPSIVVSYATDLSSKGICTVGGGSDTGVKCGS